MQASPRRFEKDSFSLRVCRVPCVIVLGRESVASCAGSKLAKDRISECCSNQWSMACPHILNFETEVADDLVIVCQDGCCDYKKMYTNVISRGGRTMFQ